MLLGQKLATIASQNATKTAFRYLGKGTSYKEAYSYINRYSYFLQNEIQHNKRVLVYMSNCPHLAYTLFALANTKNVAVFADTTWPEQKVADRIKKLEIQAIIVSDDYLNRMKDLAKNYNLTIPIIQCEQRRWGEYDTTYRLPVSISASDTDPVAFFETQGTASHPKLVAYNHTMIQQACLVLRSAYRLSTIDNFFSYQSPLGQPFYFIHGLMLPFLNGSCVTISDITTTEELAKELLESKVTRVILRGIVLEEWLNSFKSLNLKIPTLRSITPEYAPLNSSVESIVKEDYNECKILRCYGAVENCWAVAMRSFEEPQAFDTVGTFLPGVKTRIIDENGDDIPSNKPQRGQLLISGAQVATSYLNDKEATKMNMRGQWYFTGDYVEADKKGSVKFLDRKDNMCAVARQVLAPSTIEKILNECPGVDKAAIIAVKDALGKAQLVAVVVKKPGVDVTATDIQNYSAAHLPESERPKNFAFMAEMPMDAHGQINKYRLRFELSA